MSRSVLLFTGGFSDVPLEQLVERISEWGYQGVELCTWGDHLEVQRALSDGEYCRKRLEMLNRLELHVPVIAAHRVGQAVSDRIDARHQNLVPDYVWGDGRPDGVRGRAAEEMAATIRIAAKLGANVVSGFTGSPIWSYVAGWPPPRPDHLRAGLEAFAEDWHPILDVCREVGIRFAYEVHPGQVAYDLFSAELALEALDNRPEIGFTFDPSHLLWQGVEPIEFLRRFPDRIFHVHVKDAALTLNGRAGILSNCWPSGDVRRGWQFRSPGHGSIDWPGLIRELNAIGYEGPLSVDWHDSGLDRDFGAEDACRFVRRIDLPPATPQRREPSPFRNA